MGKAEDRPADMEIRDGVLKRYRGKDRKVLVPDGVWRIGESAFEGCRGLEEVRIPDPVTEIGEEAFSGCSDLVSIRLPAGLSAVEELTFSGCQKLPEIRIPDRVRRIGALAFRGCQEMATVSLPSGISDMDPCAFKECPRLEAFHVRGEEGPLMEEDGVLFDRDRKTLLVYPCGRNRVSYRVPAWVRTIEIQAFYPDCRVENYWNHRILQSVILPEGLEKIEDAFREEPASPLPATHGIDYMRLPDSLSGTGGGPVSVNYTGSRDPEQAFRGNTPVYFGDLYDLPEDRRKDACRGFFYALGHGITEILPWKASYEDYARKDPGGLLWGAEYSRTILLFLADLSLLPEQKARDLLMIYQRKRDIEVQAVLLQYLKRYSDEGAGDLSV